MVCCVGFWQEFAHWGVDQKSPVLAPNSIVEHLRKFMQVIEAKFKNEAPDFFFEIRGPHVPCNWFKGLCAQVWAVKFREAAASGEAVQKQAAPIYIEHREEISKQLRRQGEPSYQEQNCVIQLNGYCAGRPSEPLESLA